MHQTSWSYASSITQPSWVMERTTQDGYITHRSTRKDYHASTFMIIRIKHNPTILALELSTWKDYKDGYITHRSIHEKIIMHQTSWASSITQPSCVGVINMETTQDGYITHRSIHEKIIMHQTSWSYASSIKPSCRWSYQHGKSYARWLHHTPINTRKDYHASTFMIIWSSITQPSWRWSNKHGKNYTRWLHHTPIKTRKRLSCIKLHDHTRQA